MENDIEGQKYVFISRDSTPDVLVINALRLLLYLGCVTHIQDSTWFLWRTVVDENVGF